MYIVFFAVSFLASLAGAICGIGGGVVIKPVLDATGIMSVSAISFLSGCTVLSMSAVSVGENICGGKSEIRIRQILPLAFGAAAGGLIGKVIFEYIKALAPSEDFAGMIQAALLLLITTLTLIYTVCRQRVRTFHIHSLALCVCAGILLGFFSAFLGIGGGPINLMILSFLFSMGTKEAGTNSLFIILISQLASLLYTVFSGNVPDIKWGYLVLMVTGGIAGGHLGRMFCARMKDEWVNRLFEALMVMIIFICIYNIVRFA